MAKLIRKGFRPKEAPALSIARNQGKPKGRPVTVANIRIHARALHQACGGRGYRKVRRGGEVLAVPCKCATKAFLKRHPEVILDASGNAWWPADDEPKEG